MTEAQLKKLQGIIVALQDVHDAVKAGRRNADFAAQDLHEEASSVRALALELDGSLKTV